MRKSLVIFKSIFILFLFIGCGFKIVNQSELDFNIANISTYGDSKIGYIIKNKLIFLTKNNGKKNIDLDIELTKNKEIKEKNIKNEITKFQITIIALVKYGIDDNKKFKISKVGEYQVSKQNYQTRISEKKLIESLSESAAENIINELVQIANDL